MLNVEYVFNNVSIERVPEDALSRISSVAYSKIDQDC